MSSDASVYAHSIKLHVHAWLISIAIEQVRYLNASYVKSFFSLSSWSRLNNINGIKKNL